MNKIRKGDQVIVLTGRDKGKRGTVTQRVDDDHVIVDGVNLVKRLKTERPKLRILVVSMHGESQYAARALKAGASGYLTKDSAPALLLGKANFKVKGNNHIASATEEPTANLLLGILDAYDIHQDKMGSSNGRINLA